MTDWQIAPPAVMTAPLLLDLAWQGEHGWCLLHATCGAGTTLVQGPGGTELLRLLAGHPVCHRGLALLDGQRLQPASGAARHGPTVRPVVALLDEQAPRSLCSPLGWVGRIVRRQGLRWRDARARARQALGWVGASAGPARRPLALANAAERRRVALAGALAAVPGLLLLDHPCARLPTAERHTIYETIRTLAAQWEMVVLLIPEPDATIEGAAVIRPRPCSPPR